MCLCGRAAAGVCLCCHLTGSISGRRHSTVAGQRLAEAPPSDRVGLCFPAEHWSTGELSTEVCAPRTHGGRNPAAATGSEAMSAEQSRGFPRCCEHGGHHSQRGRRYQLVRRQVSRVLVRCATGVIVFMPLSGFNVIMSGPFVCGSNAVICDITLIRRKHPNIYIKLSPELISQKFPFLIIYFLFKYSNVN